MSIRSIERALAIITELNRQPASSISSLHAVTGLPKPTLVRILKTLENLGYVDNDPRLGGYQVTGLVASLSAGYHKDPMVVEAGRPWAVALTRKHQWPISIALFDKDSVAIRFSTIPDSAISPFHKTVNMRLPILTRGLGLAYFAFAPEEERATIVKTLQALDDPEAALSHNTDLLAAITEKIRAQGFATRPKEAHPQNSDTIAVPVYNGDGRVVASLGLTYFRSAFSDTDAATNKFVTVLKEASKEITIDIRRLARAAATGD